MKTILNNIKLALAGFVGAVAILAGGFSVATLMPATANAALDSAGTEFYLAFEDNYDNIGYRRLFITSKVNTSGTITAPGFSSPFTVTANTVTSVDVPVALSNLGNGVIGNKSIHIVANDEVTVYGLNRRTASTDAFLGLPVDILNTEYRIMSFNDTFRIPSQFSVVAPYNGTQVTITPKATGGGHAAGVPFTITLNQGQVFQLQTSNGDMTGSLVSSSRPVAVFAGHKCANVPAGVTYCDHLVEQMSPVQSFGMDFVTVPLATRRRGDVFRIVASQDATTVQINGSPVALNAGQFHQMILTTASHITSDKPIMLAQYSAGQSFDGVTSDPFMMMIPPSEQFMADYTFSTPPSGFTNHINVVVPTADTATLLLDGAPVVASFSPVGSSGFSGAQILVGVGSHNISAGSPFGLYAYGFGSYDSYGYPGGTALQFINPVGDANPPVCVGSYNGDVFNGTGTDNRPTEDVNGNLVLDPGEDLNGNGQIDVDTGIFLISMDPGSFNYAVNSSFIPADPTASFSVTPVDNTQPASGTVTVTDGAGNTCSMDVGFSPIVDFPPVIRKIPADIQVNQTGILTPVPLPWGLFAFDPEDGMLRANRDYLRGGFPVGTTVVTYSVTDSFGHTVTASVNVRILAPGDTWVAPTTITPPTPLLDTTAPVLLRVPSDVTVMATGVGTPVALPWGLFAYDERDGFLRAPRDVRLSYFPVGTTVVTYSVSDAAGNTATAVVNVTVIAPWTPPL